MLYMFYSQVVSKSEVDNYNIIYHLLFQLSPSVCLCPFLHQRLCVRLWHLTSSPSLLHRLLRHHLPRHHRHGRRLLRPAAL